MKLKQLFETNITQLYLDLDGVFADFDAGVKLLSGRYPKEFKSSNQMWKCVKKDMEAGNKFFGNLPKMKEADILWEHVKSYNPIFLTATGHTFPGEVAIQKKEWIRKYYGPIQVITVEDGKEKAAYASPTAILIDDRMKAIGPWRDAGGIGILHTDVGTTIRELKTYYS
jgi:hypothetical protein